MLRKALVAPAAAVVLLSAITVVAENDTQPSAALLQGKITYRPPPDDAWERAHNVSGETAAAYVSESRQGAIAIEVLPADARITPAMGPAIVRTLRQNHKNAGHKVIMDPKVERDTRFALRVHEKYQQGDNVADELHLYRDLGPRVVMVTANAMGKESNDAKAVHKAGEEVLLSAKWLKPKK